MAKFKPVIENTKGIWGKTPKGEAKWCKVLEPDMYGNYATDIYLSDEDTNKFIKELEALRAEAKKEVEDKGKVVNMEADVFKVDQEGKKYFQFKAKSEYTERIPIYNIKGVEVEDWDKLIGNGSIIKVSYLVSPYYMASTKTVGISFKLRAIQVIKLVEYGGSEFSDESEDAPFSEEEESNEY